MPMDPRIRAAMVERKLIKQETSDETAWQSLAAFFVAQGEPLSDKTDEILQVLAAAPKQKTKTEPTDDDPAPQPPKKGKQATDDDPIDPVKLRQEAAEQERQRIADIMAAGQALSIDADVVQKAIDDGVSSDVASKQFIKSLKGKELPKQQLEAGQAQIEKIAEQTMGAWCDRFSYLGLQSDFKGQNDLRYASFLDLAKLHLQAAGVRTLGMLPEDVAKQALRMGPTAISPVPRAGVQAGEPVGRPGDYANLLSGLVGKVLDTGMQLNPATYRRWCKQGPSRNDFKPAPINRIGELGELSIRPDGKRANEVKPSAEMNWLGVDPYAAKLGLTPRMIADDDLGAFLEGIRGFGVAGELTMNRLAVNVLASNETAGDGVALFHSGTHKNIVSGGGTPSQAQMSKHRQLLRRQKGVSNESYLSLPVGIVLVAPQNEDLTEQLLDPTRTAEPVTDATINTYRGKVSWAVEPMLEDYDATGLIWYAFVDPRLIGAILFAFMTGYENGKSEQWYDPETGCRWYQHEIRGGVAVNNWRAATRNPGS